MSELVKELEQRLEKFNLLKVRPYSQHEARAQESTDSQNLLLLKVKKIDSFSIFFRLMILIWRYIFLWGDDYCK